MNRNEIKLQAINKRNQINILEKEIEELNKQNLLLSDEDQWFEEKIEASTFRKNRKKVTEEHLIGRVHWKEYFIDEDDPDNKVEIDRSKIVRVDGEWRI